MNNVDSNQPHHSNNLEALTDQKTLESKINAYLFIFKCKFPFISHIPVKWTNNAIVTKIPIDYLKWKRNNLENKCISPQISVEWSLKDGSLKCPYTSPKHEDRYLEVLL